MISIIEIVVGNIHTITHALKFVSKLLKLPNSYAVRISFRHANNNNILITITHYIL